MMDTTVDYYEVLGVPITADRSAVKAAWSDLVQKHHPDVGDEADPKKFMAVQKAYEVLADTNKRLEYDRARDSMHAPAAAPVEEDYAPGWGESSDTANAKRAAAPSTPTASKKARAREWVPPHMRTNSAPTPPTVQDKPEPVAETSAVKAETKPRPVVHESWRTVADPDIKPQLSRNWKTLWLPPVLAWLASTATALVAFGNAGPGTLGTLTPAIVIILMCAALAGVILDWTRIQAGRESIIGLSVVLIASMGTVILGFGTSNYWLAVTGVLTSVWAGYLLTSLRYKYVLTRQMPPKQLREFVAYGKPGRHAASNIHQLVEQDLADHLGDLFQIPSLRLFHGLFVPANRKQVKAGESMPTKYGATVVPDSYIGQAVTAGKKAAFLTSVVWPAGHYTIDNYGGVLVNGQHTQYELDAFAEDLRNWRIHLKGSAEARMFLVVHADGPVSFDMPDQDIELVSADKVVDTLGSWLVDDQRQMDRQLNSTLAEHLATT